MRGISYWSADDLNLLKDDIGTMKENTETVTYASKEDGPEAKSKCMLLSRRQNLGQNHVIKIEIDLLKMCHS
jgi:hypothetical protein